MFSFFKRLFRIGAAEAHSALDKLENPIKMTQQGIRDLKEDFDKSLKSLAEVKAIAIRTNREVETYKNNAAGTSKKLWPSSNKAKPAKWTIAKPNASPPKPSLAAKKTSNSTNKPSKINKNTMAWWLA